MGAGQFRDGSSSNEVLSLSGISMSAVVSVGIVSNFPGTGLSALLANSCRQLAGVTMAGVGCVGAEGVQRAISACASWSGDRGGAGSILVLELVEAEIGLASGAAGAGG